MICLLRTQIIVYPEKEGTLSMEDGYETIRISHTTRLEVSTWNKPPNISPANTALFGVSRELQFGVCNHDSQV